MAISIATIERAKLVPECLPDAQFNDIAASSEVSPPILDLRRFPGKMLRLSQIAVSRDSDVSLRIKVDNVDLTEPFNSAGALLDLEPNKFDLIARDRLYYNLYSTANKTAFRTSFSLWVQRLTVADKIKFEIPLTKEESEINEEFGIQKSVEKGILPLPLDQQIEREYRSQLISEETHGRVLSVGTTPVTVESIYPRSGEFVVLTAISATAGNASDNIRISISRDDDANYITNLYTYAIGLDRDVSCFIPALDELTINVVSGVAAGVSVAVRFTIWRCRLSNLLKARWGLPVEKDETVRKVKGGIL